MREERKNPHKTHRRQFWYDVSHDQTLSCETDCVLSTCHASGVQCLKICLCSITLAAGYATTRNACVCQALQRNVWRAIEKTHDRGF